jgi:hypothetical protein
VVTLNVLKRMPWKIVPFVIGVFIIVQVIVWLSFVVLNSCGSQYPNRLLIILITLIILIITLIIHCRH